MERESLGRRAGGLREGWGGKREEVNQQVGFQRDLTQNASPESWHDSSSLLTAGRGTGEEGVGDGGMVGGLERKKKLNRFPQSLWDDTVPSPALWKTTGFNQWRESVRDSLFHPSFRHKNAAFSDIWKPHEEREAHLSTWESVSWIAVCVYGCSAQDDKQHKYLR